MVNESTRGKSQLLWVSLAMAAAIIAAVLTSVTLARSLIMAEVDAAGQEAVTTPVAQTTSTDNIGCVVPADQQATGGYGSGMTAGATATSSTLTGGMGSGLVATATAPLHTSVTNRFYNTYLSEHVNTAMYDNDIINSFNTTITNTYKNSFNEYNNSFNKTVTKTNIKTHTGPVITHNRTHNNIHNNVHNHTHNNIHNTTRNHSVSHVNNHSVKHTNVHKVSHNNYKKFVRYNPPKHKQSSYKKQPSQSNDHSYQKGQQSQKGRVQQH